MGHMGGMLLGSGKAPTFNGEDTVAQALGAGGALTICWCWGREARMVTVADLNVVERASDMCEKRIGGSRSHEGGG